MDILTVSVLALCILSLYVQNSRHKAEKLRLAREIRKHELQLKAYHRAAMHDLSWRQTKELVDMAYFYYSCDSEQERLKLEAAADTAVLNAFHEWRERSAEIY